MKVGTKSVLFGAHCFFIHPIFVAIAWTKLYGFPFDPRIWVAFFVHDLGYWGKPNMDGSEGETHVELGDKIMHFLFDIDCNQDDCYKRKFQKADNIIGNGETGIQSCPECYKWRNFSMYHSRYYAKKYGAQPSKLCFADKLSFSFTPRIIYIPMTSATGEIYEYIKQNGMYNDKPIDWVPDLSLKRIWHEDVDLYMKDWVEIHKDGREDTWTNPEQHTIKENGVLK